MIASAPSEDDLGGLGGRADRRDHGRPGQLRALDQGAGHAARGRGDQHQVARPDQGQAVDHVPGGADRTLPGGHGQQVIFGLERDHHLGRNADQLAVAAPPRGAEHLEGLAQVGAPPGAPGAAAAAVLLEGGDAIAGADRAALVAHADDRAGEFRPQDHGQLERPAGSPGAGVQVGVVDPAGLHLDQHVARRRSPDPGCPRTASPRRARTRRTPLPSPSAASPAGHSAARNYVVVSAALRIGRSPAARDPRKQRGRKPAGGTVWSH